MNIEKISDWNNVFEQITEIHIPDLRIKLYNDLIKSHIIAKHIVINTIYVIIHDIISDRKEKHPSINIVDNSSFTIEIPWLRQQYVDQFILALKKKGAQNISKKQLVYEDFGQGCEIKFDSSAIKPKSIFTDEDLHRIRYVQSVISFIK